MRWLIGVGLVMLLLIVAACTAEQQAVPLSEQDSGTASSQPATPLDTTVSSPANTSEPTMASNSGTYDTTTFEGNKATNLTCLDTDYDDDQFRKGVVQVRLPDRTLTKIDECLGSSVREWFCDKGDLAKKVFECKYGCEDGACKSKGS